MSPKAPCAYCGARTRVTERHAAAQTPLARVPHAPRPTRYLPLCAETARTQAIDQRVHAWALTADPAEIAALPEESP